MLFSLESCLATIALGERSYTLDRSCFLAIPPDRVVVAHPITSVTTLIKIGFDDEAKDAMVATHRGLGVERSRFDAWFDRTLSLPRTAWVHELAHRYLFERITLELHESEAARFLERELCKELYFLLRDRFEGTDRATIQQEHSSLVSKALAIIEAHRFERWSMQRLAAEVGASESSLVRAFRKEVGEPPGSYWRTRRLEAALDLLRTGRHSVSAVATMVGYDNPTSFGEAFRKHFGKPPSRFRPSGPVKPAP